MKKNKIRGFLVAKGGNEKKKGVKGKIFFFRRNRCGRPFFFLNLRFDLCLLFLEMQKGRAEDPAWVFTIVSKMNVSRCFGWFFFSLLGEVSDSCP